jgi:hypothetical protein
MVLTAGSGFDVAFFVSDVLLPFIGAGPIS